MKSFFNPTWWNIGELGIYGRIDGINTIQIPYMILLHSTFSICSVILLVQLFFPKVRKQAWMGNGVFTIIIL